MANVKPHDVTPPSPQAVALVGSIRTLHDALRNFDLVVAKKLSLKRTELECLLLLEHGPVRVSRVMEAIGLTSGAVTTLLDRLEKRRFITRRAVPLDRRAIEVDLTTKARARIGELYRRGFIAMAEQAERHERLEECAALIQALAAASQLEASKVA